MSDLKAIQARSLEMAEYFVAFCKEHDLLCYLCGGGAIGALLHGFQCRTNVHKSTERR